MPGVLSDSSTVWRPDGRGGTADVHQSDVCWYCHLCASSPSHPQGDCPGINLGEEFAERPHLPRPVNLDDDRRERTEPLTHHIQAPLPHPTAVMSRESSSHLSFWLPAELAGPVDDVLGEQRGDLRDHETSPRNRSKASKQRRRQLLGFGVLSHTCIQPGRRPM